MTIRVLLADDQPLLRTGFRMILEAEPDLAVVGEASDGARAVELTRTLRPDVVLMDIRMPGTDGIAATRRIAGTGCSRTRRSETGDSSGTGTGAASATRVLVLTTFDLDEYIIEALRAGASGFLLKDVPADDLIDAIRVVAGGQAIVSPSVTRRLLDMFASTLPAAGSTATDNALANLTEREGEVFRLMAKGMSNAEIASSLVVGETTVKTHVGNVLTKLSLRDRIHAVVYAYETGVIRPGGSLA